MKNSKNDLEEENELTKLSLWFGSPKRSSETQSLIPSPPPLTTPQTNLPSLMQVQIPNPKNPFLISSSDQNPKNPFLISSSDQNPNLLLPPYSNNVQPIATDVDVNPPTRSLRRSPPDAATQRPAKGNDETVPAPFRWAMNLRATVHSRKYLLQNNIYTVTGKFHCRKCHQEFEMSLDVEEKINVLRQYIEKKRGSMHDRAPNAWSKPVLPRCVHCGQANCAKPIIERKKRSINWLFLLLSQTLGLCTMNQLKYFCKHTNNHRTGAKNRLLYLTYMTLCKQLVPDWFGS